ncbi:MAG: hypothetical protein ABJD11_06840 [Gemmatimonadota bacterium]
MGVWISNAHRTDALRGFNRPFARAIACAAALTVLLSHTAEAQASGVIRVTATVLPGEDPLASLREVHRLAADYSHGLPFQARLTTFSRIESAGPGRQWPGPRDFAPILVVQYLVN